MQLLQLRHKKASWQFIMLAVSAYKTDHVNMVAKVFDHNNRLIVTERERQLKTARANQTTGLTNGWAANWAPKVEFSPFRARFAVVKWRSRLVAKSTY